MLLVCPFLIFLPVLLFNRKIEINGILYGLTIYFPLNYNKLSYQEVILTILNLKTYFFYIVKVYVKYLNVLHMYNKIQIYIEIML